MIWIGVAILVAAIALIGLAAYGMWLSGRDAR